jgi:uncharacterized membrane protein
MKRVAIWFKIGLVVGLVWLILNVSMILIRIFGGEELNQLVIFLYLDLLAAILNLIVKFFLLGAGIFYLWYAVGKWDEEQEQQKNKFEFEKEQQPKRKVHENY